jgi:hypothetical protein
MKMNSGECNVRCPNGNKHCNQCYKRGEENLFDSEWVLVRFQK